MSSDLEKSLGRLKPNIDISKGIALAISIEKKAKRFYLSAEKKSPHLAPILSFLAREEGLHLRMIQDLKESLKTRKLWIMPASVKEQSSVAKMYKGMISENETDILLAAAKAEKIAMDCYTGIAEKIGDSHGKKFFSALAKFEHGHYNLISSLLDMTFSRVES